MRVSCALQRTNKEVGSPGTLCGLVCGVRYTNSQAEWSSLRRDEIRFAHRSMPAATASKSSRAVNRLEGNQCKHPLKEYYGVRRSREKVVLTYCPNGLAWYHKVYRTGISEAQIPPNCIH